MDARFGVMSSSGSRRLCRELKRGVGRYITKADGARTSMHRCPDMCECRRRGQQPTGHRLGQVSDKARSRQVALVKLASSQLARSAGVRRFQKADREKDR